jgi:hypothetical protein
MEVSDFYMIRVRLKFKELSFRNEPSTPISFVAAINSDPSISYYKNRLFMLFWRSIKYLSVSRQVNSLFQTEFSILI